MSGEQKESQKESQITVDAFEGIPAKRLEGPFYGDSL